MAGKREIKTSLKLEGEAQFKKGMNDAASAIKVLNSEQKLAEAQFEATGDAEQYAAEKTRILKEKIEQQEKAVKNAKDAVEALKKDGVDENSKAMQTWKISLNRARTSLITMKTKLNDSESALKDQGQALDNASGDANEYKDTIGKAAQAVDFTATITAIDNVRNSIKTIVEGAGRAALSLINLERGAAGWADELASDARVADLDVETYQGWLYASQLIDTSVDSIVGSYKRLNKNLDEPTDDILKSLNEIGVYNLDPVTGQARDTMDVFWDIVDALGTVENKSRRDQIAMELLGKSFDDLNPLIAAGSDAYKGFVEEGKQKAVSKDNIDNLTALDDAIVRLEASFDQTKYTILGELAPAFESAASAIDGALVSFNEFLNTDEGQQALADLRDAIGTIGDEVADISWKDAMKTAGDAIRKVTSGFQWIAEHKDLVKGAIAAIAGAWGSLTVLKTVLSIMQLIKGINWKGFGDFASGNKPNIPVANANDAINTINTGAAGGAVGGSAKTGILKKIGTGALGVASKALPYALVVGGVVATGQALDKAYVQREWGQYNDVRANMPELTAPSESESIQHWQAILQDFQENMVDKELGVMSADLIRETFGRHAQELLEELPDLKFWDMLGDKIDLSDGLDDAEIADIMDPDKNGLLADAWIELGRDVVTQMAEAIQNGDAEAEAASQEVAAATEAPLEEIDSETIGYNVSAGMAEGISDGAPLAIGAAEAMGEAVAARIAWKMETHSPSRLTRRLGGYVSKGFALGIEDNIGRVEKATNRMVNATTRPIENTHIPGAARGAAGATGNGMTHITIQMDGRDVADVITPYVDSNIGATIARRR